MAAVTLWNRTTARAACLCATLGWLGGCAADVASTDRRIDVLVIPSRVSFVRVSDAMQLHCGTLDCHGQVGRNLRLYGHYGLRLASGGNPLDPPTTTSEEYDASFWSVIGLEPEIMSRVAEKLIGPESRALVRKPRGVEMHKGGQLMTANDALDRCIVGWLTGDFQFDACNAVADATRPDINGGSQP